MRGAKQFYNPYSLRSISPIYRLILSVRYDSKPIKCTACKGVGGWDIPAMEIVERAGFLGLKTRTRQIGPQRELCFQCEGAGWIDPVLGSKCT